MSRALKLTVGLIPVLRPQLDLGMQSLTSFTPHAEHPWASAGVRVGHRWPGTPVSTLSSSQWRMLAATSWNTFLTSYQGGEGEKGHDKCLLVHLPACPVPCFAGIWLQPRKPKGGAFKADVWHFTIKTLPPFFQQRKSLTPSQMHRQVLLCLTHLWRVSLGSTSETTEILSPLFMCDRTGSTWPRQAILLRTPSLLTVPPSPSLSTYPLKAVPMFMQWNTI